MATFSDVATPTNQAVLDLLDGYLEVSLTADEENFTAYWIKDRGVVWICGSSGGTTVFQDQTRYQPGSGADYYVKHLPDCF